MAKPANPTDIARETIKQLASRRLPPTPENYRRVYLEIAEVAPEDINDAERALIEAFQAAGRANPTLAPTAKLIIQAIEQRDWSKLGEHLESLAQHRSGGQGGWAELVRELLRQWDLKQRGLTTPRKREALERVLINFGKNSDELLVKLRGLVNAWSQGAADQAALDGRAGQPPEERPAPTPEERVGAPVGPLVSSAEMPGLLAELLSQALRNGVMPRIAHFPELAQRAEQLAEQARGATDVEAFNQFARDIRQFWIELELRADADKEVLDGLMRLLRLLIDNITELLLDDQWLRGQLKIVEEIIANPLSPRVLNEAEQRLKEVIFKQGTLKHSLNEAKATLKHLVTVFIERIGEMSDNTGEYHQKIEHYAEVLSRTEDLPTINAILQDLIADTKALHLDMVRSHEDLMQARRQAEEAEARIRALEAELGEVSELVYQDHLTGTLNRRGMEEAFVREFARAERNGTPLSVALMDIDHFKKLNDTYGHEAGDQALVHLANVVREILRPSDVVARYGGEEFIIIFPETAPSDGVKIMVRLQRELTKRFFLHNNEKVLITFSAGVAQRQPGETSDALIARADGALYRAKQAGRNRVCGADPV